MTKILFSLLVLLSSVSVSFSQEKDKRIDSAFRYIDDRNHGKAINIYNRILAAEPKNARVYQLRGLAYEEMKDYESALRDFNSSIAADRTYWLAYLRRADLFSMGEVWDEALKDYDMAQRYANKDSANDIETILVNRSTIKKRLKNTEGAVDDLRKALEVNPTSIGALVNLGAYLSELNKTEEAIQCLEKVIKLDSTFEGGYGNLAFLYSETGEYKKALDISNKLLSFKPDEAFALNNRGYIKYKMKDYSGALEDINNSILNSPTNSYAFRNRGLVYIALKKNREACADFQKALTLGFTEEFGDEVQNLVKQYCGKPAEASKGL